MAEEMEKAVREAAAGPHIEPSDRAVVELALIYARRIDADGDLKTLGPPLLAVLESLQMTPRARAAAAPKGAGRDGRRSNPLDELRNRRAAREHNAATVDSAAAGANA